MEKALSAELEAGFAQLAEDLTKAGLNVGHPGVAALLDELYRGLTDVYLDCQAVRNKDVNHKFLCTKRPANDSYDWGKFGLDIKSATAEDMEAYYNTLKPFSFDDDISSGEGSQGKQGKTRRRDSSERLHARQPIDLFVGCFAAEVDYTKFNTTALRGSAPSTIFLSDHPPRCRHHRPRRSSSVPALAASDIEHAIALIQAAYSPSASSSTSTSSGGTAIQSLQSTLLSIQRTPAAWALVLPLLAHADPNVQFFGAHTAHAKIARGELSTLTPEEQEGLRRELVREAGVQGRTRVVRRKVYGAVVALAVRLVPLGAWGPSGDDTAGQSGDEASQDWIGSTVRALAAAGVRSGDIHEFLSGVAEDVGSANLLPQQRCVQSPSTPPSAAPPPLVVQSVAAVLQGAPDDDLAPALTCLAAWLPAKLLPDAELAALVPLLIALLNPQNPLNNDAHTERTQKIGAALSDLLARPPASWGPAVLLEPLLLWAYAAFPAFSSPDVTVPDYALRLPHGANAQLTTHARLLVALADAGVEWVAGHLVDASAVQHPGGVVPRAVLAQTLVRLMLALSAQDPGGARLAASYYAEGASPAQGERGDDDADDDDDDGEQQGPGPLGFWYLLQEALWEIPAANTHLFAASASHSPFPSNPSTPLPQEHDMDDDDPERFRRGSPWTPGVVRTGSYAFSGAAAPADEAGGGGSGGGGRGGAAEEAEKTRTAHARAAYVALVRVLRAKAVYRLERFAVYRRDVGDTIINAYYILRDDLLVYLVDEAAKGGAWRPPLTPPSQTIESPLFLLRAVHEALDLDSTSFSPTALPSSAPAAAPALSVGGAALDRLFGDEVWGRLPMATGDAGAGAEAGGGQNGGKGGREAETRLRRTALGVVDTYAAYFTTRAPEALLAPLRYVLGALGDADAGVCLQAALALRSLCDANRRALAARISAFAEVHAGLGGVPVRLGERKVLQSIASVIQALPPAEGVAPVEALVGPVLQRLGAALGAAAAHPEPARATAILQLEFLAGIARGLTRTADPLAFDEDDAEGGGVEVEAVRVAREDPRTGALRDALFNAVAQVAELWSADAEVGQALSELFKAITALPADVTLLLNGVWLALAAILIAQLNPPPLILSSLKTGPSEEAEACVRQAVGALVTATLGVLGAPGGMVENPDIVQEFFACMDRVAQDFTAAFCTLPDGAFDALIQCAISALALQERYSLVAACTFLGTLIHRVALYAPLSTGELQLLQAHMIRAHGRAIMRAVLCGFAGAAPRSVSANLLELLSSLVSRWDERAVAEAEGRDARDRDCEERGRSARVGASIVFAEDFIPSRAGHADKERFVKTVVSSRSVKKTKEAANQFMMVAWGMEGSTFGYSSAS
ncbi:hypothetical protein B0H14DRAFT_3865185 [Mycena olivaceomarginata]|nr:hypothetical protein B0H14DRAFT_3865185 [Mycena olivaceomarginata]